MSIPTVTTTPKTANPLKELSKYGQSAWLDYIRRNLITSGELKRLVEEDGLGGVTSNPAIFEKAITGSTDYADALLELQRIDIQFQEPPIRSEVALVSRDETQLIDDQLAFRARANAPARSVLK